MCLRGRGASTDGTWVDARENVSLLLPRGFWVSNSGRQADGRLFRAVLLLLSMRIRELRKVLVHRSGGSRRIERTAEEANLPVQFLSLSLVTCTETIGPHLSGQGL